MIKLTNQRLGIDLGNTIIKNRQAQPDAYRVIERLITEMFGDEVYIISRVNEEQKVRAQAYVRGVEFQSHLHIPDERIHYCSERSGKAPICEKLGITHFIDDRPEVMADMPLSVVYRILFDPVQAEVEAFAAKMGQVRIVRSWNDVERLFFPIR